ncbi:MAG: type II toxin-antitoxin system VapC family toxin [Anaerolineae bacterium]
MYYADASALVKHYVQEPGSDRVRTICTPGAGHMVAVAQIGLVEVAAALGMKHRRGQLTAADRDELLSDLQRDGRTYYVLVDVDPSIVSHAIELTRRQKLRGYDAVHLACALFVAETMPTRGLPKPVLLSADDDLLEAAQNEGLAIENPNAYR